MKQVSFIGAGNMATAIIKGILRSAGASEYRVRAYDVLPEKAEALEGLGVVPVETLEAAVTGVDFLFLSVKPQNFEEVLVNVKPFFSEKTVVVSIAAGITAGYIKKIAWRQLQSRFGHAEHSAPFGYGGICSRTGTAYSRR